MGIDAGAHGIIVPYLETLEQAQAMVGAVKFRPLKGKALEAALQTGEHIDHEVQDYLRDYNSHVALIFMIESQEGIDNLPDILTFGGVDAILVGPHDLSISLGIPEQYDHLRFEQALDQVIAICQHHGVAAGMHLTFGTVEQMAKWVAKGLTFVPVRGDTLFVAYGAQYEISRIKESVDGIAPSKLIDLGTFGHGI
jgi:4-hydroxy-2-oxoheptanedioate aldolase